MRLILTHENADFDAVASQLAAFKLYPDSVPLLPRRLNRNVQQFLTLYWGALPFVWSKDWHKRSVTELLLVDTQSPLSVRGIVKRPLVRVIDHHLGHTPKPDWVYHVEAVGATTTLLVEKLQQTGLTLAPDEATLLLAGIYEDTGSLTYDTTTARDAHAAAWLLEQGARLNVVRRFLNIPLTPAQQKLYDDLQATADWIKIGGRQVVVATAVAPDPFEEEISSVAHRLRDSLSPNGLFVLVQLGPDVQLVARSNEDHVDVSRVARALGGGGHSRAAAALVPKRSLALVKAQVMELLLLAVKPADKVMQLMSYGLQTLSAQLSVAEAAVMMQRFGYEGFPVVDGKGELVGLLTRRAVDRAINHDMSRLPINRIMKTGKVTVRPSDSIEQLQHLMLHEGWGQIPVVDDRKQLIGIVTRTDLLNYLFRPLTEVAEPDMRQRLSSYLSRPMWGMVLAISEMANTLHMPLYFVGGLVRDLLLNKPPLDLDMVVEGDGIRLARELQSRFGGDVHTHSRFGTAKWQLTAEIWHTMAAYLPDEARLSLVTAVAAPTLPPLLPETIDFVTARTEFYREPSALPEVERGSIKLDLHRRDFTINTLAVRLDGAHLGELLDFYGGQRDLEQGLVRVLHSISFVDDPTRMLRAARLEQRLGFVIEERTAELLTDALPMLARVTGDRIRHELELSLREEKPAAIMARLDTLGVLAELHAQARWSPQSGVYFDRVPGLLADGAWQAALQGESPAFVYFALWLILLAEEVQTAVMQRLRVRKATREDMQAVRLLLATLAQLSVVDRPSQVARLLRPFPPRVLLVGRATLAAGPVADLVERYYHEWRGVKTAVTGDDLRARGLKPGPLFAHYLDTLLAARLDGLVANREEEMALLTRLLAAAAG